MSSSEHCRGAIFQIYNVQNLKITITTTFRICNVVYQEGFRWDPKCVFNFLRFFERTLYKSNYIIFILSWCGTHTKIRSKLVDIVTAGSQEITLCGPQRTPLGILRVKCLTSLLMDINTPQCLRNVLARLPVGTAWRLWHINTFFISLSLTLNCEILIWYWIESA